MKFEKVILMISILIMISKEWGSQGRIFEEAKRVWLVEGGAKRCGQDERSPKWCGA